MKKTLFTIIIALFFSSVAYMQSTIPKAQTMFIYNFSRLIEWPPSARSGNFVIGVFGATEITMELELYTKGKKVGTRDIVIQRYKALEEISGCHILFVPFEKTKRMPEILNQVNGKSTLIITEKSGALSEGAAINFLLIEDKLKFEIKPENASKYGIKLSAKLQEMSMQGN
jgi:hypothetical protein